MGRTIVITGVTRGLGRSLLDRFHEAGHTVLGCGRSEKHVRSLREQFGDGHAFAAVDVADDAQVAVWAKQSLAKHGPPDLLINNAALINRVANLWEISAEEFDAVIDVNLKGVANVIRHFVPAMVKAGRGVIANLSSGWGRTTSPHVAPYCCTKFGIEGLSKAMAQELPAGMACVALNPGIIDTDMLRVAFADGASGYPSAEQWSGAAAKCLLGLNASHNGQTVIVPQ